MIFSALLLIAACGLVTDTLACCSWLHLACGVVTVDTVQTCNEVLP